MNSLYDDNYVSQHEFEVLNTEVQELAGGTVFFNHQTTGPITFAVQPQTTQISIPFNYDLVLPVGMDWKKVIIEETSLRISFGYTTIGQTDLYISASQNDFLYYNQAGQGNFGFPGTMFSVLQWGDTNQDIGITFLNRVVSTGSQNPYGLPLNTLMIPYTDNTGTTIGLKMSNIALLYQNSGASVSTTYNVELFVKIREVGDEINNCINATPTYIKMKFG